MLLGIAGGIVLDVWYQSGSTPIVYAREPEPPRQVQIEVKVEWTPERISQEVQRKAQEYGVSASEMERVIECESHGSTTIQSRHIQPYGREESFGLAQIHLRAHPHVTKEQAIDPAFAIEFMAKHFAQGKHEMWSCY